MEDKHLKEAIYFLKKINGNKGYMICISVLNENGDKLGHYNVLGSHFKLNDIDNSFEESRKNIDRLSKKYEKSHEIDLSKTAGEIVIYDQKDANE